MPFLFAPARRGLVFGVLALVAGCASRVDAPPRSILFFNPQSAELDPGAMGVIGEFAGDAKASPTRTVVVAGYADKLGTPQANRMLSALRAQVVTDALVSQGVDRGRIVQQPRGQTDSDPGVESRRVELSFRGR